VHLPPTLAELSAAAANVYDAIFHGGVADLRRTPASIIDEAPQRTVFRYHPVRDAPATGALPVLLVPPLAAPPTCFDLRRGCSLVEHLLAGGRPTYLVDYGSIGFSDRDLGLEHWIDGVLPGAIRAVSEDAGGAPVQLVGWCLGGIMALLTAAADRELPIDAIATVASPFDFRRVRLLEPFRLPINATGGWLLSPIYRALGTAPAPIVRLVFQLASIDKELTKPLARLCHLDDREFLAQIEAVDAFTRDMQAYPGRTFGQLYHRFFRVNDLADGRFALDGRVLDLRDVTVPVMAIAGDSDVLAPRPAVHHVASLLPNAAEVRLETGPGGHLGVLTGRAARTTTWVWIDEFFSDRHAEDAGGPGLRVVA